MELIRAHVARFYQDSFHAGFAYHNLQHTEQVREAVVQIAENCNVSNSEMRCLEIAAWFHDIGYSKNPDTHEAIGAEEAANYLYKINEPVENVALVKSLILATYYPKPPEGLCEMIIKDADLCYLGTDGFWEGSNNLREEWASVKKLHFSDREWIRLNITFLLSHRFFTQCASKQFGPTKQKNLNMLLRTLSRMKE